MRIYIFRKISTFLYLIYNRFQNIILTIFVVGLLDMMAYSDLVITIVALPEFTPIIISFLIIMGALTYLRRKKKKNKQREKMKEGN